MSQQPADLADRLPAISEGSPLGTEGSDALASPQETERKHSAFRELIETLLIAALIFVVVRALVLNYRVDGHSMDPTLDNGEMLIVNRNSYASFDLNGLLDALPFIERDTEHQIYFFDNPDRGDIIVFHPPVDSSKPYIKRIIGLPGETVSIENGNVYINGELLEEPYIESGITDCGQQGCGPWTLGEDEIFVMGDNRRNSSDSRFFGPVQIDAVIGKAFVTYWPADDIGLLLHQSYPDNSD